MKLLWVDTETTGLNPENAAPFQISFIYISLNNGEKIENGQVFWLNPLTEKNLYSDEAGAIHGYSKEKIETFPSAKEVTKKINAQLKEWYELAKKEKMCICGYNVKFDIEHIAKLMADYGFNLFDYVEKNMCDVFSQVKEAGRQRILPYLENRKLTTIARHFNIDMKNAHDATVDILATREVSKALTNLGIPLRKEIIL